MSAAGEKGMHSLQYIKWKTFGRVQDASAPKKSKLKYFIPSTEEKFSLSHVSVFPLFLTRPSYIRNNKLSLST